MKYSSSFQNLPHWPGASVQGRWIGYCPGCQESLFELEERCGKCGLEYDSQDARSFRHERRYDILQFWLPALLLAILAGILCHAFAFQGENFGYGLMIGIPVSVGVIIGYSVRFGVWVIGIFLLVTVLMVIGGLFLANIFSVLLGVIFALAAVVPALFGVLLGWALRIVLQNTNWHQRHFLPLVALLLIPHSMHPIENVLRVEPGSAAVGRTPGIQVTSEDVRDDRTVCSRANIELRPMYQRVTDRIAGVQFCQKWNRAMQA